MPQPNRPRRKASTTAKIVAFSITGILCIFTVFMLISGPSDDFADTDGAPSLEGADEALQNVADGLLSQ